jgi:hypothetical protein
MQIAPSGAARTTMPTGQGQRHIGGYVRLTIDSGHAK